MKLNLGINPMPSEKSNPNYPKNHLGKKIREATNFATMLSNSNATTSYLEIDHKK